MNLLSSLQPRIANKGLLSSLRGMGIERMRNKYNLGDPLGRGGCGYVYEIIDKRTRKSYACKVLSKGRYRLDKLYKEIGLLSSVEHTNIVSFKECYESNKEVFIVMKMAKGGELFQVLRDHGKFDEVNSQIVIKALLSAVKYLQSKFIVHRDIKLENIMLLTKVLKGGRLELVKDDVLLIDFGLAKKLTSLHERTKTRCGSKFYVAPEIWLDRGYTFAVDLWSIGVVMYMLLTNTPPFCENKRGKVQPAITLGEYFEPKVSYEAKELLKSLLKTNPARRIKPDKALKSNWFGIEMAL